MNDPRRSVDGYIPTLDGWRAVAIGLVLLAHASDSIRQVMPAFSVPHAVGLLGVQIFFGISGFLITTIILRDERKRGRISLRAFYLRRAFRILPAAIGFLLVAGALALVGVIPITPGRWWATLLFFSNYSTAEGTWYVGHFWSLAVEEHFYLVWPVAFVLLGTPSRRLAFAIVSMATIAFWRAVDFKFHLTWTSPEVFFGRTDIQVDSILGGAAIALLYALPRCRSELERWLALSTSQITLLVGILAIQVGTPGWKTAFLLVTVKSLLIPLLLVSTVFRPDAPGGRVLETAPLRRIGVASYSLYLYQQLFLVWDDSRADALSMVQSFPANLVCAFVAAYASMRLIELPMIALGHRLSRNMGVSTAVETNPIR